MVTISHRPEIVQGVKFQIGRTSIPDRPILIAINNVEANLTTQEAADLAYIGKKIKALLRKAAKSGDMPDARRLMSGHLAGAEFAIGISVMGEVPGVDLQVSGRTVHFVGEDIDRFCSVLAEIDAALGEHRCTQPGGGVQQLAIRPDWGFEREGWYAP